MGYRIKTVAELTGVGRNTLLAWERRYSIVSPDRMSNGYRSYSEDDVAKLVAVKRLVDDGLKVSEAVSRIREKDAVVEVEPQRPVQGGLTGMRAEMLERLCAFDRAGALQVLSRMPYTSYRMQLNLLYKPILRELGEGWLQGRVSVAQEHFASGFCREQIQGMLVALDLGPATGPGVVLAGFPGDSHELPLLIVATQLALRGQRITWLGADVPADDLALAVEAGNARMACISVVLLRTVGVVEHFTRALRNALPDSVRLVLGGPGLPTDLPAIDGVEICHDIESLSLRASGG